MDGVVQKRLFVLFIACVLFPLPTVAVGQNLPAETTAEDLQKVVTLLEDPEKREAFVQNLKAVIRAESTAPPPEEPKAPPAEKQRELLLIEHLFDKFEALSAGIIGAARVTARWAARAPDGFAAARAFLADHHNRSKVMTLLGDIGTAVLVALLLWLGLRRYSRPSPENGLSLSRRIRFALIRWVLGILPFGALLAALFIMFRVLPSYRPGQSLALLVFTVLFFYRLTLGFFRVLLCPDDERLRIAALRDENANYCWIWVRRFADYTAFFFLVITSLMIIDIPSSAFSFIRGVLLMGFPVLISVFLLQIARELRRRSLGQQSDDIQVSPKGKTTAMVIRYWPWVVVPYTWAVFIFLLAGYGRGFDYLVAATLETALTGVCLWLALTGLGWIFQRLFDVNQKVRDRFPGLEQKTNRYIRVVRKVLAAALVIIAAGVTAQAWGLPAVAAVSSPRGSLIILRVIAIAITTGIVISIIELSQFLGDYLMKSRGKEKELSRKLKTLIPMCRTAVKVAAGFIGGIVVLGQLGVNTTPILAGAGIVGLAVGFGSQTLVKDLINGLFILFEESARVGDWAVAGTKSGQVEAIGLRTMRLRDLHGNVHVVPNSSIEVVTNLTKEFSRYVLDVGVAYRENVDEVIEILKEIGDDLFNDPKYGHDMLEPLEIFGLDRFEDSAVVVRARLVTKPLRQWALGREFKRRMKKVFDERGIEIPFPHRTVYMGEPKEGLSPPLHVRFGEETRPEALPDRPTL